MATEAKDQGTPPSKPAGKKLNKLMSKRTVGWTSVKTPATSVGAALKSKVTGIGRLEQGIRVTKVTSRGQLKPRILTISEDRFALFCTHGSIKGGVLSTVGDKLPLPFITRKGMRGLTSGDSLREKYVRYIDVADIDAIQLGVVGTKKLENARTEPRLKGADSMIDRDREQIVSIVHHGNETMDVLIPDAQDRKDLIVCLQKMCRTYNEAKKLVSNEALLLRYIWYDVDVNRDGLIGEKEFVKILSRINFYVKYASKYYRDFVNEKALVDGRKLKGKSTGLTYVEIMTLLQQLKEKEKACIAEILWDELFDCSADVVSAADFLDKFMHGAQGQTQITIEDVQEIFTVLNQMEINHNEGEPEVVQVDGQLSRARFEVYLFDLMNSAYNPWTLERDGNVGLNKPISMYWINTSHNTYLTGNQLNSESSVEMYAKALRRGCKCLELDCWDGETVSDGKPIPVVFHGHTLTSKILFSDIVRVVKSYMESEPTSYPVILSLENHCSHPYQLEIANIMEEILGDLLYVPTAEDTEGELPSPEKMRGKVVIKGKRPPDPDDNAEEATDIEEDAGPDDQFEASPDYPTSADGSKGDGSPKAAKPPKIVEELARLTLFHGTKWKSFEQSIQEPCSHMHSIGETKIAKILAKRASNVDMWRQYNVHHLTRTYPAGKRVDSSNYNPTLAWSMGCQLVALNFQTSDAPLILNDGKFRQHQGAGYLEKPRSIIAVESAEEAPEKEAPPKKEIQEPAYEKDALDVVMESFEDVFCGVPGEKSAGVEHIKQLSPTHESSTPLVKERIRSFQLEIEAVPLPIRLKIRVLGGSCLPKPKGAKAGEDIDPYVTVTVHDVKRGGDGRAISLSGSFSTDPVDNNGFCPVWNEKEFKEFIVHSTDVAMVHFSLSESDIALDDKVADAAIPVSSLRRGYRSIQLFDQNCSRNGPFGFATLLVEIQIFELK